MLGFLIFQNIYLNLGEKCRNKVLGNIFEIDGVSVSWVIVRENKIIFRMFSNGVFYQYLYVLGVGKNKISYYDRIVDKLIFVLGNDNKDINDFIYWLVRCCDEYEVYQLIKKFL